jgi:hypothetical protein
MVYVCVINIMLLQSINAASERERKLCAPLRLSKIVRAQKLTTDENMLKYKKAADADGFVADLTGTTQEQFTTYQVLLLMHIFVKPLFNLF